MKATIIGSMNCMPTEYAILLKKYCSIVVHYYDADKDDLLSNPKNRWGEKSNERISGVFLKSIIYRHYLFYIFPKIFHKDMIVDICTSELVILSGPSISLARLISKENKKIVALSYGSDISLFCNPTWPSMIITKHKYFRKIIIMILKELKQIFSKYQILGLRNCTHYSYFIPGVDHNTDKLIENIFLNSPEPIRLNRYSVGLDVLEIKSEFKPLSHIENIYKIVFPVRFCADEMLGNKGYKTLFDALKIYKLKERKLFKCVCFKKGEYKIAQNYAKKIGIDDVVEWHEIVSFNYLIEYYRSADIIIEQLGTHMIGQGLFAMLLGKPVIGRLISKFQEDFFSGSGFLNVDDSDSLTDKIIYCETLEKRNEIGEISRNFILNNASIEKEFLKWNLI